MKRLLLFLPAENAWSRIIRRGVVIGVLTLISVVLASALTENLAPGYATPILVAILAMIDKSLREFRNKK